jgi:CubicO group peptidase (beta-lactamase class C family)
MNQFLKLPLAVWTAMAAAAVLGQSNLRAQAARSTVKVQADPDAFTREVKRTAELLKLPGYTVAVVQGGKIVYRLNGGEADVQKHLPVTDRTVFSLASVTKSFTAIMLMQYEDEKKISLDDYLLNYPLDTTKYVPSTIDVNTRLKHVLSMTSGDVPGMTFDYSGWRYSMLSGVFEQMTHLEPKAAYEHEVTKRILGPLKLNDTFDGYPEKPTELSTRVAQGYALEAASQGVSYKPVPYDAGNYYPGPSAGLFSTVDDLAAYTSALDENRLISSARYNEMTSPFVSPDGRTMPYGYGWMTQTFEGLKLHWVYGEGRGDSALLLRVPERRLTLIMLANSVDPSSAARLHDGNVLRSPVAIAFLKYFVLPESERGVSIDYDDDASAIRNEVASEQDERNPLRFDELMAQAQCRYYTADILHQSSDKAERLLRLVYELHPQSFDTGDVPLMWMLGRLRTPDLQEPSKRLIRSFDVASDHRPEVLYSIGSFYEVSGDRANSIRYYKLLADRPGFNDEWYKIDGSLRLGRAYTSAGDKELGRTYIWKSALESRGGGFDAAYVRDLLQELRQPGMEKQP